MVTICNPCKFHSILAPGRGDAILCPWGIVVPPIVNPSETLEAGLDATDFGMAPARERGYFLWVLLVVREAEGPMALEADVCPVVMTEGGGCGEGSDNDWGTAHIHMYHMFYSGEAQ